MEFQNGQNKKVPKKCQKGQIFMEHLENFISAEPQQNTHSWILPKYLTRASKTQRS